MRRLLARLGPDSILLGFLTLLSVIGCLLGAHGSVRLSTMLLLAPWRWRRWPGLSAAAA